MLQIKALIQQAENDCSLILLTDQTGDYSSLNQTGYGGSNPVRSALSFRLIRTSPLGDVKTTVVEWGTSGVVTICANDWDNPPVDPENPYDCGCTSDCFCKEIPADGCFTYELIASTDVPVSTFKTTILHSCELKKRLRRASLSLGTSCVSAQNDYLLRKWALAWDMYQFIDRKAEVCCATDGPILERAALILTQIGY